MFHWLQTKLDIAGLEKRKADLVAELAKLEARFTERGLLAEEWTKIHTDHKETIAALLEALKGKK